MSSAIPITEHPDFTAVTPSKSYPLPFWSGLFEKKHYGAMGGGPVFLFGYLVDRTTKEDSNTHTEKVGIVLGGKPIKDSVIGRHFGITTKTVARFREVLIAGRYIETRRTPCGYRYTVLKSKKFGIWGSKRSDRTVQSGGKEIGQKRLISTPEIRKNCPVGSDKTVRNKEDHAVDHAVKQQPAPTLKPQEEVWGFLGINPCGPISFRVLLESRWASRNGHRPSDVVGETVDAWEAAEGEKLRKTPQLFKALSELRQREKQETRAPEAKPIRTLTAEEIPV